MCLKMFVWEIFLYGILFVSFILLVISTIKMKYNEKWEVSFIVSLFIFINTLIGVISVIWLMYIGTSIIDFLTIQI